MLGDFLCLCPSRGVQLVELEWFHGEFNNSNCTWPLIRFDTSWKPLRSGQVPRKYGEMPKKMGNYERIAPSEAWDNMVKSRSLLFNRVSPNWSHSSSICVIVLTKKAVPRRSLLVTSCCYGWLWELCHHSVSLEGSHQLDLCGCLKVVASKNCSKLRQGRDDAVVPLHPRRSTCDDTGSSNLYFPGNFYIATQKNEAKLVKRVKTCQNMSKHVKTVGLRPSCSDMWFV